MREFKLNYLPVDQINLFGQYGLLKRGVNFESERMDVDDFNQDHNNNNDSVSEAEVDDANSFERISSCCG